MISTIKELQTLPHKEPTNPGDWENVHQSLRILAYELVEYCKSRNLPLVITSIIRPMIKGVSKTDIHSRGRAFDCSVQGWSVQDCLDCEKWMNDNYGDKFGAISISDGKKRACVYHNGTGMHLHIQCRQ